MLLEFPTHRHLELLPMYSRHQYLSIMIKSILKDQAGQIYVDNLTRPKVALATYKVLEFVGGLSRNKNAKEVIKKISENKLLLFPNDAWVRLAKRHLILTPYPRTKFITRLKNLRRAQQNLRNSRLPDGYVLEPITIETLNYLNPKLIPAILPFYKSPEDFIKRGLGYCVRHVENDLVVSIAAASMPIFDNEYDILAITDPDQKYRRKGLATFACNALIKESLKRGIRPHWDSDNEISTRFALKLGFRRPQNYTAYICSRNPLKSGKIDENE